MRPFRTLVALTALLAASSSFAATRIWSDGLDAVQLDTAAGASNLHPFQLPPEQVMKLVANLHKQVKGTPAPMLDKDAIAPLATALSKALAQAKPNEDVLFQFSYRPMGILIAPRQLAAGRAFIENGQLNLIFGMCDDEFEAYQLGTKRSKPVNYGNRAKASGLDCVLAPVQGVTLAAGRNDWLRLDLTPVSQPSPVTATLAPSQVEAPQPAASLPLPVATQPIAPVSKPSPSVMPSPASRIEERLVLLKRLKENGLITDAEYQEKRAAILKEL
ncbi:SHOCT domain-containing protein [Parachitinimonas caeni]|uniref:SHOCT domain-containing protein n=1 Tax=Parachitinimonas caeni TaxID=3031301 RepID=A0ABT7DV89_9NEIS|nr:SHOCT domain-containing protein [Parachitinimonas caeni]MDK2123956.1 SHOCT domain-containing protein [Parachitinimonas caeni]